MGVYMEKAGDKFYGDIADSDLGIRKHKEFVIDSADDVASLPGIDTCAPGSFATTPSAELAYRLSIDGVWTKI